MLLTNRFCWFGASALGVERQRTGLKLGSGSEPALELPWWKRGKRGQETVLQEDSPSFQRQQRHSEPVAGDTDYYGLQAPTTDLWKHHPPAERAERLLCSLWGTKQYHCTEDSTSDQVMTLSPDSVRRSLSRINARKAPGPDNIPGRVLRDCAVELTDVFTDIFNISLSQAVVPTCFKATTIIPVPKKSSPSCFNDYRPVALTPILMKCFEQASHAPHQVCPPPLPGPLPVCILGPTARPMMPSPLPSTQPSHIWTKKICMSECCS